MDDAEEEAITHWVSGLRGADHAAAKQLWESYFDRLVAEARKQMRGLPRRSANEEDLAASVFESLYRGATEGRFNEIGSRDDLWRVLVAMTRRKAIDQRRHNRRQKRGAGQTRGDSVFMHGSPDEQRLGFDGIVGDAVSPEFIFMIDEEFQRLLALLRDDDLRKIATSRMEGYSNQEIADQLGISVRSVARKMQLIRDRWLGGTT